MEIKIYDDMLVEATKEELTKEMEMFDKYRKRYLHLKLKCEDKDANKSKFR